MRQTLLRQVFSANCSISCTLVEFNSLIKTLHGAWIGKLLSLLFWHAAQLALRCHTPHAGRHAIAAAAAGALCVGSVGSHAAGQVGELEGGGGSSSKWRR
mmetsp:Transcript_133273/g.259475  ORF Transcript_133273/g.259475 Transcript_133273/m.259475 type:complete len:100 (-) Transcript_133273:50-349(-)